ncbi:MAG: GntR family transcriptional regulator [Acidimicrobiia bacterium]|nr:MAG: GntR family transcriptional regulator [Acidimicrobiia bacterium]
MITRNPSLTDQVKAHIKERITSEGFDGGRIPPETELASDLGVSRTTVRDALSRLEHEGTIYRRQGAGTFVSEQGLQIKSRLEDIWSYEQVLEDHGYEPSVRVLAETEMVADSATVEALDLADGDTVLVVEKLFLEDEDPVMLTVNRIPTGIFSDSEYADDEARPVYEFIERHCDRTLNYYLSEIIPVSLDADTATRLGVEPGTLAISFDEIGFDQNNEPIVRGTSYFRDDLIRFRLIRRRSRA